MTARTGPPAITPVPSGAGFSKTSPLPNFPSTVCWMVVASTLILRRFFLAASIPFLIAAGTSLALPVPNPTICAPGSPTTTRAEKLIFLPPLTTFVTRLIETTCSLRFRFADSIRFVGVVDITFYNPLGLEQKPAFTSRVGQGFDPAMIQITAPVEHHRLHALLLGAFGQQFSDCLGAGYVAAIFDAAFFVRRSRRQGVSRRIVDNLRVNVLDAAENGQPWPFRAARHFPADAFVYSLANDRF